MRVSLIIPSFYPAVDYGGPIFSSFFTTKHLSNLDNITVYVSTTNANKKMKLDVQTNKWIKYKKNFYIKYYNETIIGAFSLNFIFNAWRDIKKSDLVHIQSIFSISTVISLIYSKIFNKKIILSPRGQLSSWALKNGSKLKKLWLLFFISPHAQNIIFHATSQQEKIDINSLYSDSNIRVIPNGVDFDFYQEYQKFNRASLIKYFTNSENFCEKIIVSMGRLHHVKGFDILIKSFCKTLKIFPNAKLLIAGKDDGEKNNLTNLINDLDLQGKVFLIGEVTDQEKVNFLANADLFVLASHTENFGNVYIESLAAGTPIIASKNTPWSEVQLNDCGEWVSNSPNDIMNSIIAMLRKDRELMRLNSKKYANKFDHKNIANSFHSLFYEIK
jgi:glycosyltransferase involved in cell wall biosynthesis